MTVEEFIDIRTQRRLLQEVFWECTLRCNLNCLHCGSDCRKEEMPQDMPFSDFARVLDQIVLENEPSKIMIITTGGEPLVRKDIVECGREITRRGFIWGMVSNGMLLDTLKLQQLINAGLKTIAISLDGFEAEHNWMRGNDNSFRRAVNAIKALTKSSITWDVITCVNARNFSSLSKFKDFLLGLGVTHWRLFTVFPMGRAANNTELEKQCADDKAEFISIKKSIPSEDMVAVQAERYTIHDEYTKSNIQKLQEKYGRKYSYDIYKDVEADVNMELHEKPFSILMRLEKNKQRNTDHNHTKYRNHEQER